LGLEGTQCFNKFSGISDDVSAPYISLAEHPVPSLLQICWESRVFGLKKYEKLTLGGSFKGYICFQIDTVSLSPAIWRSCGYNDHFPRPLPIHDQPFAISEFSRIQHIELFYPTRERYGTALESINQEGLYGMLKGLKSLMNVTITCGAGVKQDELQRSASLLRAAWRDLEQGTAPVIDFLVLPTSEPNLPRCLRHGNVVYFCWHCGGLDRRRSLAWDHFIWSKESLFGTGLSTEL